MTWTPVFRLPEHMIVVICALVLLIWATLVFVGDLECVEGSLLDDLSYCLTYGVATIVERALPARLEPVTVTPPRLSEPAEGS